MTTSALRPRPRLRQRLAHRIVGGWPSAVLLVALPVIFIFSIQQAKWVDENRPIILGIIFGLLVGGLLTTTRWKGWFAGIYSIFTSLLLASHLVGRIGPSLSSLVERPVIDNLDQIRNQGTAFSMRVSGWIATLQGGGQVSDQGLFVFLFTALGLNVVVYLVWWTVRRKQPLPGLLPLTILMAINAHVGHLQRIHMLSFLAFAVLLLARGAYIAYHHRWTKGQVDYSEELGGDWGGSAVAASLTLVIAALIFSFIGTREGWRAIRQAVERSRTELSETAEQLFGGVNPPPPSDEEGSGELRITSPNLGDIGAPLPRGSDILFTVWTSDPAPLPDAVRPSLSPILESKHYWRSEVYSSYTGRGWETFSTAPASAEAPAEPPAGRYRLEQRYTLLASHRGDLFGVNQPVSTGDGAMLVTAGPDQSLLVIGSADQYTVFSYATSATISQMNESGVDYPAPIKDAYLQLPSGLPERVGALAREVAGDGTPYEKAERLQAYLRQNFRYDLEVKPSPAGRDVVDYFLFESQAGFCSHFATAMAVMLRAAGVPARVAAGYAMGTYVSAIQQYQVPVSSSHAWVEVYFNELGWVEFEPTPAYDVFFYEAGQASGSPGLTGSDLPAAPERAVIPPAVWLLAPIVLVILLWAGFFALRRRRELTHSANDLAVSFYRRVRNELTWAGLPSSPSSTPHEFRLNSIHWLGNYPRLSDGLQRATDLYVQAAYSNHAPFAHEVRMGEWRWRQARGEWFRLLIKRWLKAS